jgi:hypothetical protein
MRRIAKALGMVAIATLLAAPEALAGGSRVLADEELQPEDCLTGSRPHLLGVADPDIVVIGCADAGYGQEALVAAQPDGAWDCYFAAIEGAGDTDGGCWREPSTFRVQRIHYQRRGPLLIAGTAGPSVHEVLVQAPPTSPPRRAGLVPIGDEQSARLEIPSGFSYFVAALPSAYDTCHGVALTAVGGEGIVDRDEPRRWGKEVPLPDSKDCRAPATVAVGIARMILPWF